MLNFVALRSGDTYTQLFSGGLPLFIIETPTVLWELVDLDCGEIDGLIVTEVEDSIEVVCDTDGGTGICSFVNTLASPTPVPTLSESGMIAAAMGLALVGIFFVLRSRRTWAFWVRLIYWNKADPVRTMSDAGGDGTVVETGAMV